VTDRPKSSDEPASAKEPIVFVVDDDVAVRMTLSSLFPIGGLAGRAVRFSPRLCADQDAGCCKLPGPRYQAAGDQRSRLSGRTGRGGYSHPDHLTGHGDIPMSVKAMKAGAIDFLTKPFRDQDILDA
jgi:hypothetical protein